MTLGFKKAVLIGVSIGLVVSFMIKVFIGMNNQDELTQLQMIETKLSIQILESQNANIKNTTCQVIKDQRRTSLKSHTVQ